MGTLLDEMNNCDKHGERIYFTMKDCPTCKDERIEKLESVLHEVKEVLLSGRAGANVDHALNVLGKIEEDDE